VGQVHLLISWFESRLALQLIKKLHLPSACVARIATLQAINRTAQIARPLWEDAALCAGTIESY
jgi:hypothetical protein